MGFLDDDDQMPGFHATASLRRFLAGHVTVVDAPRQEVARQDIGGQVVAVPAELKDHMLPPLQVLDDAGRGVMAGVLDQETESLETAESVVQRTQRVLLNLDFGGQFEDSVPAVQLEEPAHPFLLAEFLLQVVGGRSGHLGKIEGFPQKLNILGLDLPITDADNLVVGRAPP